MGNIQQIQADTADMRAGHFSDLFDFAAGKAAKTEGVQRVGEHNENFVDRMRGVAIAIAQDKGTVSADDLRAFAERRGIAPSHPNAWGAVFNARFFECTGVRIRSKFTSNHAREIKVWRLKA